MFSLSRLHAYWIQGVYTYGVLLFCCGLYGQGSMYSFQDYKMGTAFEIKIFTEDTSDIYAAVQAAWHRIDEVNDIFSDYSTTSELYFLQHQHGMPTRVSPIFSELLSTSLSYSRCSRGVFDVTVGSLSRLWRRAIKMNELPSKSRIDTALKYVGFDKIKFEGTTITIPDGVLLDFGAIAKGFAVDEAVSVLRSKGLSAMMVDGGGDLYVGDAPTGSDGWKVLVTLQLKNRTWIDTTMDLTNKAIVTSGDRFKFILDAKGRIFSHIIDPHTGYGIPGPHQTTVIASTAMHADALATSISILCPGKIRQFRRRWRKAFPLDDSNWTYFKSKLK